MWFYIFHNRTAGFSRSLNGADLVDRFGDEVIVSDVEVAATKTCDVVVTNVCADADVACMGCAHSFEQHSGVAGMETAGNIGAGHQVKNSYVVAHDPAAVAFAEVAVEIDGGHEKSFQKTLTAKKIEDSTEGDISQEPCDNQADDSHYDQPHWVFVTLEEIFWRKIAT